MATIDYRGFRLTAMSVLPINEQTLIYGSADTQTVRSSDPHFNGLVERLSKSTLNLKPHLIAGGGGSHYSHNPNTTSRHLLYLPFDCEGHRGRDDRYYLIDFARLFPPQALTDQSRPGSHLYQLLRPELVASNPVPLSSDAYLPLGKEDVAVNHAELTAATDRLFTVVIPQFAKWLDLQQHSKAQAEAVAAAALENSGAGPAGTDEDGDDPDGVSTDSAGGGDRAGASPSVRAAANAAAASAAVECECDPSQYPDSCSITELMHRVGINMRHLFKVFQKVTNEQWRWILVTEMVVRTIKHVVRQRMRETMKSSRRTDDQPYRTLILDTLNKYLLYRSSSADMSWVQRKDAFDVQSQLAAHWTELTKSMRAKFAIPPKLTKNERRYLDPEPLCHRLNRRAMFIRLTTMLGLVFSPQCLSERMVNTTSGNWPMAVHITEGNRSAIAAAAAIADEDEQSAYSAPLEQIGTPSPRFIDSSHETLHCVWFVVC